MARHFDKTINRVANKNNRILNVKTSEMSWKEYDLKETNEEQRQETNQIVDLLVRRGYDLITAFAIASIKVIDGHIKTKNTDEEISELISTDKADKNDVSQVFYKEKQKGNRKCT